MIARSEPVGEAGVATLRTPDFYLDDCGLDMGVPAMTAMKLHYMRTFPRGGPAR